jgi:hypothetical protein
VIAGACPFDVLGEGFALQLHLSRPLRAGAERKVEHLDGKPGP